MTMIYTQSGETYGLPSGDYALHGNKICDLLNHELASFDNAEDAAKAAEELDKAIERGDKTFTFAEVEEVNAIENILDEIDNGKYAIESIESRVEKITSEFNEVKDTAEQSKAKEIQFLIDCANEEIDFAKKRIADAMKEINGKNIDGAKAEVAGMIERIEYAEETFDRANSVLAAVEEINAENADLTVNPKFTMAIEDSAWSATLYVYADGQNVVNLYYNLNDKPIIEIYGEVSHSTRVWKVPYTGLKYGDRGGHYENEYVTERMWKTYKNKKAANEMIAQYGLTFDDVEKMFDVGITHLDAVEDIDAEMRIDDPFEDAIFEEVGSEIEQAVAEEKNSLKAKVAEIENRPRKSVIDWKATFDDMKVSEILNLQKDLKKFLKLGQIDLAENVFSMLKTLCKNYREQVAA